MTPAPSLQNPGARLAVKRQGFEMWCALLEEFGMDAPFTTDEAGALINERMGYGGTTGRQYAIATLQAIEAEGQRQAVRVGKRGRWTIPSNSPAWRAP